MPLSNGTYRGAIIYNARFYFSVGSTGAAKRYKISPIEKSTRRYESLFVQAFFMINKSPSYFVMSLPFYTSPNFRSSTIIGSPVSFKIYKKEAEFYREFLFELPTNSSILMSIDSTINEGLYYTIEETTEDVSGWEQLTIPFNP